MFKSLDNWLSHIKQLHDQRTDFNLDRINAVANRLQLKKFSCPVITIAGTNGKGSVAKTLESIYFQAGFKTALYTSPHLMTFNERIRINNGDIDDEHLLCAFSIIETAREKIALGFFEFVTLTALLLFQEANCDVVILEVGLGGRFDAVNIVESDVAVLTSVALDHTQLLGNTRELIAFEKASIARAGKLFICGDENPPSAIAKTVAEKKATLIQIHRDYFYDINNHYFSCSGKNFHYDHLPLPTLKPQNVATAIAVIHALQNKLIVSLDAIKKGIAQTQWPGRFEIIASPLPCILDVAHNPQATQWLAKQYQQLPRAKNTIAVVGMLKDKLICDSIEPLLSLVDKWFVCNLQAESSERGSDGMMIAALLEKHGKSYDVFASVFDAMYSLRQSYCQNECDRALIFGSFYTVAAAKQWLLNTQGETQWKKKSNSD